MIRPAGQSDQLSTSEFSFSSVLGRVSRSSPPFLTKCHAQERATYSCFFSGCFVYFLIFFFFFLFRPIFMTLYCIIREATTCFCSCSHFQLHSFRRGAAFMAIAKAGLRSLTATMITKLCPVHWICTPLNKRLLLCLVKLAAAFPL